MNHLELKVARIRRKISGKDAGAALGLTVDGYFKKEHGDARLTLSDAFTLTKLFQLSLEEFTTIFFDGELPFLQNSDRDYKFREFAFPLKEARAQAGLSAEEVANTLGLPVPGYKKREDGRVRITLEQCRTLSKMFGLSMTEFNDVFFRSGLPFGKEDLASFTSIIPQKAREINVEASNGCRV